MGREYKFTGLIGWKDVQNAQSVQTGQDDRPGPNNARCRNHVNADALLRGKRGKPPSCYTGQPLLFSQREDMPWSRDR